MEEITNFNIKNFNKLTMLSNSSTSQDLSNRITRFSEKILIFKHWLFL